MADRRFIVADRRCNATDRRCNATDRLYTVTDRPRTVTDRRCNAADPRVDAADPARRALRGRCGRIALRCCSHTPAPPVPAFNGIPFSELVDAARKLYVGLRDTPAILDALDDYGYDADDAAEGLALVDAALAADATQQREYAEQYAATAAAEEALLALEILYTRLRKLARRVHPRGTPGYTGLGLDGDVPDDDDAFIADAERFYRTADADPTLVTGVRGLNKTTVADGLAHVETARAARDAQAEEAAEAQQATGLRTGAVARLRAHAAELAGTATDVLDPSNLRESLGLMDRGA